MKLSGTMLVVKDMDVSRSFYKEVLSRTVFLDLDTYVDFEDGLCLMTEEQWAEFLDSPTVAYGYRNNVCQLGFEHEDIDAFWAHLEKFTDIEILTPLQEYEWGQRSVRFYDPDKHLIEVGENMKTVVKRFLTSGMSVEETMEKSMFPREFVEMCKQELNG